uniref:Uncharacterized protein n=1 Tax=Meleagris gallopavo TaxID=9103 RepID=H9H057_MELGA
MRSCVDFSYGHFIRLLLIMKLVTPLLYVGYWRCSAVRKEALKAPLCLWGCSVVAGLGSWGFPPHLPLCAVLQEEVRQAVTPAEPVQYYFTLAQQPAAVQVQGQQQGQQTTTSTTTIQPGQIIIAQPQQGQPCSECSPVTMQVGEGQQVQIVQAQPQGQSQQAQSGTGQTMQVMQQIITNTGEIQQIPVQLNAGQLQYIRLAQPVSGTQVVQGQIQTLATNAQQITQTEVQQGQQQFSQFTDGQVGARGVLVLQPFRVEAERTVFGFVCVLAKQLFQVKHCCCSMTRARGRIMDLVPLLIQVDSSVFCVCSRLTQSILVLTSLQIKVLMFSLAVE